MTALPDPLLFAVEALAARGALVEPGEREAVAVLPAELATRLSVPEELRLVGAVDAAPGTTACGLGAPLLERLVSEERGAVPVASLRLDLARPRDGAARAAADRFVVRNGLADVVEVHGGEGAYLAAAFAFTVEADDRSEGLLSAIVEGKSGALPDEQFAALVDPGHAPSRLVAAPGEPAAAVLAAAAGHAAARALRLAGDAVAPIADSVRRRQQREQRRITEYFAALVSEASAPRRRMDAAAVEAKVAHYRAEEAAKLGDLDARFRMRVRLRPAALWTIAVPTAVVTLRLRRRKGERLLTLALPAGARSLDTPACEACGGPAARPLLCDDRLHLLCERCAPSAEGRPRCLACRGRA